MIDFIVEHRAIYGVEPICRVLPIAPSTYHAHAARRADPGKLPARAQRDTALKVEIGRVYAENFRVYGVRKVWRQLGREGLAVARCTVARLMRTMGLQGVVRGKTVRTTISNTAARVRSIASIGSSRHRARMPCGYPTLPMSRRGLASSMLLLSSTLLPGASHGSGFARPRTGSGWRVSRTAHAGFVLDALEQALHERRPDRGGGLDHHSDSK